MALLPNQEDQMDSKLLLQVQEEVLDCLPMQA